MRPKLTLEYQEIMWAVAQQMDASFLRPIFDKYNPRATQTADLARRARELAAREVAHEAARVAHEAARVAHKAHTEHERAELAAQSQAATLRLQSAISKEADRAITADMLSRAVELRTTHDALRTMVRGIAHEICADVRAPVEYGSRLLAALGESDD
jgi:hypothetical protein